MMRKYKKNSQILFLLIVVLFLLPVIEAATRYKPFIRVLSSPKGKIYDKARIIKDLLRENGYKLLGEYEPFRNAWVLAITNEVLLESARNASCGPFAAVQRVAITKINGRLQIAFTNPVYLGFAYRSQNDLTPVKENLEKVIGDGSEMEEFGSKRGKTKRQLLKYHYTFGMEYCNDVYTLATFDSHNEAIKAIEKGFTEKRGGVSQVYKAKLGRRHVLYGVAMTKDYSSDKLIFSKIDYKNKYKHTPHLPYEMRVDNEGRVTALHTRFRIAISWPDLKMAGDPSFLKIIKAPDDIEKALRELIGKDKRKTQFDDEFDEFYF